MSSKAPIKRAATKPATNKETKQQKTANNDDLDDLFADVEVAAPGSRVACRPPSC